MRFLLDYLIFLLIFSCLATVVLGPNNSANAHEFWLEPLQFIVREKQNIIGHLKVGSDMKGSDQAYFPNTFKRFEVVTAKSIDPVLRKIGAYPALKLKPQGDGLIVIIYESTSNKINYDKWEKFEKFAKEKGLTEAIRIHQQNEWQKTDFKESYRRFAKALVASGTGDGQDRPIGFELEFVALENPYGERTQKNLPIQLLYRNTPRKNSQIEIFSKNKMQNVVKIKMLTDDRGIVNVPLKPGHKYLINSVKLITTNSVDDTLWESLWASLTFEVPF